MAREFAGSFYRTKRWRKCRDAFIAERTAIDGGMCEMCGAELGYIVHHKTELAEENIHDDTVALGAGNLMWLCHTCHNQVHGKDDVRSVFVGGEVHPPQKIFK